MPVIVRCPQCGKKLQVPAKKIGDEVACPSCCSPFLLPQPAQAVTSSFATRLNEGTIEKFVPAEHQTPATVTKDHVMPDDSKLGELRLSKAAREIATGKPGAWEHKLFGQVILDECGRLNRASRLGSQVDNFSSLTLQDFLAWGRTRGDEISKLMSEVSALVNANHESAFGPPGIPGNVREIVNLSLAMAGYYERALNLMHEVNGARPDSRYFRITRQMAGFASSILDGIERFGRSLADLDERLATAAPGSTMELSLRFDPPDPTGYEDEFRALLEDEERRILDAESATGQQNPNAGYLYLLMNPSMPGRIKVGKTERSPAERARELGSATGVPEPFLNVFELYVEDCDRAERHVHAVLTQKGFRVSPNREFFTAPSSEAIAVMLDAQKLVAISITAGRTR